MAEVGLLPFARIALQVCRAVLPRYRSRFRKHQFTQPQLLAILCLMRYEDWTFREAEVRLGEHRELRQALGLGSVPDFTTLYRFLQRLDDGTIDRAVGETVRRLRGGGRKGRRRARVAVDATGLAQGAVSTFFVRRMHPHGQKPLPWRHWLKWVVVVDLDRQFLLSQVARRGPWNDCANLPAVVEAASEETRIGLVLADAEFDSERNHPYIRQHLGAQSVIPAKRGKKTWRIHGVRAQMQRAFPRRLYRRRALIESLFSSVKRKLSARAPGRSLRTQKRQALLLGLSFNLYRLRHRYFFSRMSTEPIYLKKEHEMTIMRITPVLPVPEVEPCVKFWVERVGFKVTAEVPDGNTVAFAMLERDGVELMYQSFHSIVSDNAAIGALARKGSAFLYVEVKNLDEVITAMKDAEIVVPLRTTFYGMKELGVKDPAGHVITFAQKAADAKA